MNEMNTLPFLVAWTPRLAFVTTAIASSCRDFTADWTGTDTVTQVDGGVGVPPGPPQRHHAKLARERALAELASFRKPAQCAWLFVHGSSCRSALIAGIAT